MQASYDIAIIGAGSAGMSAAITAANAGASVVVLDDKPRAGGQIYRNVSASPLADVKALGADYLAGVDLVTEFNLCAAERHYQCLVWHVGDDGEVLFSQQGQTQSLHAREIIVSTGAMERPFPIPGWHLPGVMTAGSAQVMLKSDGVACDDAVFVGTGPLLYLIVAQYVRLGVRVKALVDTTPKSQYLSAMQHSLGVLAAPAMLLKGLSLLSEIRQADLKVYRFAEQLQVVGEDAARALRFRCGDHQVDIPTEQIFLHQGVIPNLNMTRALGLEHKWSAQQLCWQPVLDQWGQSSISNISVAGDGSGIVGAQGAACMGRLAALNLLSRLGVIDVEQRDQQSRADLAELSRLNHFRRFIDQLYRPMDAHRIPQQQDTLVCRCEEQTVAQLRAGFEKGATGPNELKGLTRCGMGPCQGRQCGHTVSELLADWRQQPVSDIGYYRLRSPQRLLTLTELSRFNRLQPAQQTVEEEAS